jgi:pimeloyl-ACP methyl ester carboxylesterase
MSSEVRFLSANGLRFGYLEAGRGPLVLLVHGFPDTAHTWDAVLPAVAAAGFRAVAPFQRGYPPTEIPPDGPFDGDTLGADMLAILEALGEQQAILVGHDWGASAVFSAVGLAPTRVRLLVTVGIPQPASIRPSLRLAWIVRHFFTLPLPGAAARIRRGELRHLDELVQRWSPAWQVPAGETDAAKRSLGHPGALEAALGYYRANRPKVPPAQRRKIAVPAVAFAGLDDTIDASMYDAARRRYTGPYEVVRMRGGHFMHREHPDEFIRELLRVLAPYRGG